MGVGIFILIIVLVQVLPGLINNNGDSENGDPDNGVSTSSYPRDEYKGADGFEKYRETPKDVQGNTVTIV